MSEYTLTTGAMREWYIRADHAGNKSRAEYEAEFDRWLAGVKAEAIREVESDYNANHDQNMI